MRPLLRSSLLLIPVVIASALLARWLWSSADEGRDRTGMAIQDAGMPSDPLEADEDRLRYIEQFITLTDLKLGPDTRPADLPPGDPRPTEDSGFVEIGGLWRFSGVMTNQGELPIRHVDLVLNPTDASDNVLGSYVEDILHGTPLEPGASKPFKFTIPAKKEYSGRFLHRLR